MRNYEYIDVYDAKRNCMRRKEIRRQIPLRLSNPNGFMYNAVTNEIITYNGRACRVGSCYENLCFKVSIGTGEAGVDTNIAFFSSPDAYELMMGDNLVNDATKERWYKKFNQFQLKLGATSHKK
jgi:hypothetical protein